MKWLKCDRLTPGQVAALQRELTFTIKPFMKLKPKPGEKEEPDKIIEAFKFEDGVMYIPRMAPVDRAIKGILGHSYHAKIKCTSQARMIPEKRRKVDNQALSGFKNRHEQMRLVKEIYESDEINLLGGGILQSPPGTGKTIMGAEFVARFGRRAVILVHKEFLFKQWIKAFKFATPKLRVAEVGGKRKLNDDWREADVCIAMTQTLLSKKFQKQIDPEFYSRWGLVMPDEVHRYGAEKWQTVITMFDGETRLGLSATPRRADGCTKLINFHIGPVIAIGKGALLIPKVKRVQYRGKFNIQHWMRDGNGRLKQPIMDGMLVERKDRNEAIIQQCAGAVKAGRNVMVLTARREHAKMLKVGVEALIPNVKAGLYMSGLKKADFEYSEEVAEIVFGTWQMAQEGLDIKRMDTLVMATPRSSVEQGVGRILRDDINKKNPIVVDIIDVGISDCVDKFNGPRRSVYRKLGTNVDKVKYFT